MSLIIDKQPADYKPKLLIKGPLEQELDYDNPNCDLYDMYQLTKEIDKQGTAGEVYAMFGEYLI